MPGQRLGGFFVCADLAFVGHPRLRAGGKPLKDGGSTMLVV